MGRRFVARRLGQRCRENSEAVHHSQVRQLTRMELAQLGRVLLFVGVLIVAIGLALVFAERIPLIGRLPGDLTFGGEGWTVYIPIGTSILLSLLLTAAFSLVSWARR